MAAVIIQKVFFIFDKDLNYKYKYNISFIQV